MTTPRVPSPDDPPAGIGGGPPTRLEALHAPGADADRSFWLGAMVAPSDLLRWSEHFVFDAAGVPGSRHRLGLDADSRRIVGRIGRNQPLGEFVVVLAAVVALLHRTTGRDVIWIESPLLRHAPSRYRSAATVPLVFRVPRPGTLRNLLEHVRDTVARSYAAQGYPVGQLWAQGAVEATATILVTTAGLHAEPAPTADTEVMIRIDPAAGSLDIEDLRGMFPAEFLDRTGGHINGILHQFDAPNGDLGDLAVLTDDELEQLIAFTDTREPALLGGSLTARLRAAGAATPTAPAVVAADGQVVSYGELVDRGERLAHHLRAELGVLPGTPVATVVTRTADTVVALIATLFAGGVYLPVDPATPTARLRALVDATGARALLVHSAQLGRALEVPELPACCVDLQVPTLPPAPSSSGLDDRGGTDVAAIISTSGSAGRPKPVELDHEGLVNVCLDHVRELGLAAGDRYLQFMSLSFDGSLLDIGMTLLAGAALVLPDAATLLDPRRLEDMMVAEGVTVTTMTPSYLALLDAGRLTTLRVVVSAAETARRRDATRFARSATVFNGYGPTEACVNTTLHRFDPDSPSATVPIGLPRANKEVYVVDADLRLLPRNAIGEIAIAGCGVARGYRGTAPVADPFVANPFSPHPVLYRSGDLGAWNDRGELVLVGRRDHQVKIRGYRVEPGEIEHILLDDSEVTDAVAVFDPAAAQLVACVAAPEAATEDASGALAARLRGELAHRLPPYMMPAAIHVMATLPRNEHGKVDRPGLVEFHHAARNRQRATTAPANELEAQLAAFWADALEVEQVSVEDDFFLLGGDSIRVIRAVHQARQAGLDVATHDVIEHRTIRALAAALAERGDRPPDGIDAELAVLSASELAELPPGAESAYPLSAMQQVMVDRYESLRDEGAYHCVSRWLVEDDALDIDTLCRAVQTLVHRHPALRTTIRRTGAGRLAQVVRAPDGAMPRYLDLRGHPESDELLAADVLNGFEIGADTPFARFLVVRRTDARADIYLSAHHAVLDGWSQIVLQNELFDAYERRVAGLPVDDRPPAIDSRRQFVALERELAEDPDAGGFWTSELDALAALPRPWPGPMQRGAPAERIIDVDLTARVRRASRSLAVSPKALCLSAFVAALHRSAHLDTFAVGVISNGRSERLADPLGATGLFWNVLPVRCAARDRGLPEARDVQAVLDRYDARAGYPIADRLPDEAVAACFNFVHFHHARAGGGRLRFRGERIVHDRLHFPICLTVSMEPVDPTRPHDLVLAVRVDHRLGDDGDVLLGNLLVAFELDLAARALVGDAGESPPSR